MFQGIRKLPPGHTITVARTGPDEPREYWDLRFQPDPSLGVEEAAGLLYEKLRESVSIHLESEVPLGAFLSGGIDSSAVVGIMSELMDRPVNTASIGFRDEAFDELPYARAMARRFHANPYEKTVDASAAAILDQLAWHYDEPFADSSMVPTYYVSQVARERVTVCLSGDGGDENFAGYRRYLLDVWENRFRSVVPRSLRRPVFGALGKAYPKLDWMPRVFRAKTTLQNLALDPEGGYFHTVSWLSPEKKRKLYRAPLRRALADYDSFSVLESHFRKTEGWDPLARIQYVDIKTFLVDDILTKVDRASMAHSLEVRVPLLDHEVMEFAASLPSSYKIRGSSQKYVLKKAVRKLVGDETLHRRKMGFSVPLARWFRGELKPLFEERMFAKDAFVGELFETAPIRTWWDRHQSGVSDFAPELWALLVLESWGRRFLRG
jgi:asparagine synthase (glutamine-hydrolysing)